MSDFIVYRHTAPNGKVYIGITCQAPVRRWRKGESYKHNDHFYRAINKYGWDNFKHEILFAGLTKEQAEQKEINLITLYDSTNADKGYNIEKGGNHHYMNDSTREKLRVANLGKKQSEETVRKRVAHTIRDADYRNKIALRSKGRRHNKETCAKLSLINIGNKNAKGCCRTEKHKELLSQLKSKVVFQTDANGNFIAVYKSLKEAEKITGISKGNICECIHGKRKHAGGYVWSYQTGRLNGSNSSEEDE